MKEVETERPEIKRSIDKAKNGEPFLAEGEREGVRVIVEATGWDPYDVED